VKGGSQTPVGGGYGSGAKGENIDGGYIDAAFVPFADQDAWEVTPLARGSTIVDNVKLGYNADPNSYYNSYTFITEAVIKQGYGSTDTIMKIGQTTGKTTGIITVADTDTAYKQNVFSYNNAHDDGDSGGPVYYYDSVER